ncbi:TNFAIP3-interacting protein 1-like isoform X2 [Carassius gibelio]|uniref:TNFAIP3-interacting protein 1-like isoform X2 n=1 Tax=Carassius gibelio TaxID=101364 RepID=UPI002279807E|nr:TNFAIP3-interacting protein 1-like isoform X2 [Carassius gibelio]
MEGSLQSSLSEEDSSSKERSLPEEENDLQSEQVEEAALVLSGEEHLTLITESMSITSSDEEKLQLLNKNTELRRLNKELMKLNEEWDHIYHSTSVGLQQRVAALEEENRALKQLNSRLLLKVEHEQNKREYYEQTLMQELKKNQHLQEYVRLLESRLHQTDLQQWTRESQTSDISSSSDSQLVQNSSKLSLDIRSIAALPPSLGTKSSLRLAGMGLETQSDPMREVRDLKEQLEALRCQLKVYEDDFQKERSDKRILQRLLMKKSPAEKDPVLVHRCNNEQDRPRSDRRKPREEQRGGYVCPKHCEHHGQPDFP